MSVANDFSNCASVMKPLQNPKGQISKSFQVGEHLGDLVTITRLEKTRKLLEGNVRNEFSDPQRSIACWCREAPLIHTHTRTHSTPYTHTETHTHTQIGYWNTNSPHTQELVTRTPILSTKYSGFLYTKSKYDRLLFFFSEQIKIFLSEGQKNP